MCLTGGQVFLEGMYSRRACLLLQGVYNSRTCLTKHVLQEDSSYWRVYFIGGHVLQEDMCYRRICVTGEHEYFTVTCICNHSYFLMCVC